MTAASTPGRVPLDPVDVAISELSEAAVAWWLVGRPLEYSEADHFDNPTVNCNKPEEKRLAVAVRDLLRSERDV